MKAPKVLLIKRPSKLTNGRRVWYWTLRWSNGNGRPRYKSLGRIGTVSRSKAEAAKRQMIVALGTGKVGQDKPTRMTLSEFIEFHETQFGLGKRPTTLIEWRTAGNHAVTALGDKLLDDVTWTDAGEIRAHLDHQGRSEATIRKTLSMFRAMLGRAAKRGMILENPLADEQLGAPIRRPKRIFSEADLDAMIEVAEVWWKTTIMLAHTSGLRRAELLHLRWSDFDSGAATVRVEEHRQGRYVAAGRDVPILAWQPKTKRSSRTVPIPPQTVLMLLRTQCESDSSPYIFLSVKRLLAIDAKAKAEQLRANFDLINNFTREFGAIQDAAKSILGLDNWSHGCFHDLRKTFATRAAANGVPMHELQAHLGHSSITTTAEFYTDVEKSAADRLRAVFTAVA